MRVSRRLRAALPVALVIAIGAIGAVGAAGAAWQQQPARDTPAQQAEAKGAPTGSIVGRVMDAATLRPMIRARVLISASELPGGRGALTDESGAFAFAELPAGRYTVSASKTGYVGVSYGQRRPLQAGTPLQLADGQRLEGIELRLPRGSAISGTVYDELGDPLPGAQVRVMRYQYAQGSRQLTPAGGGQTDDRGQYRVWGLNPGEYYVSALIPNFTFRGRGAPPLAGRGEVVPPAAFGGSFAGIGPDASEPVGYAPTYYPGVPSVHEARPVTVGLAAEAADVTFSALLVRTARIAGRVTYSDGSAAAGSVALVPEGQAGRGPIGPNYGSRLQKDGAFAIANVPPGRYTLRTVGGNRGVREYVALPVTIGDVDLTGILLVLEPGATFAGTVLLQPSRSAALPDLSQFQISAPSTSPGEPNPAASATEEGSFMLTGVPAGLHWIRARAPRGWMPMSAVVNGRDVIDTPFEVRSGQTISGITVTFTDRLSEINGAVTDEQGAPMTEYTVLAFPTDPALWQPQARQIMTARPDQLGSFQLHGLPAGDYFLTTIDPEQQGEWYDPAFLERHRSAAAQLTLGEGEVKTHNFRMSTR